MAEININKIAELSGVSRATVSRYLNDGYVSQEKRARIRRAIEKTGYVPSRQARTLRTGKTQTVAAVIPKINSASVSRMVAGITDVLNEAGYQLILANANNDPEREVSFLRYFSERGKVDGIILMASVFTPGHKAVLERIPVPVVLLDQVLPGQSCVYQDDRGAAAALSEEVLKTSRRPAYIAVRDDDVAAGKNRREGFLMACAKSGVRLPDECIVVSDFTVDGGYTATERLLEREPRPDAVVCATDAIAFGALTCLREHGLRVPGDVAVAGMGDNEFSQVVTPRLTSVHYHYKTSGSEAARMLLGMMTAGDSIAREMKMGFEVVVRDSTRPAGSAS